MEVAGVSGVRSQPASPWPWAQAPAVGSSCELAASLRNRPGCLAGKFPWLSPHGNRDRGLTSPSSQLRRVVCGRDCELLRLCSRITFTFFQELSSLPHTSPLLEGSLPTASEPSQGWEVRTVRPTRGLALLLFPGRGLCPWQDRQQGGPAGGVAWRTMWL